MSAFSIRPKMEALNADSTLALSLSVLLATSSSLLTPHVSSVQSALSSSSGTEAIISTSSLSSISSHLVSVWGLA